MKKLSIEMIIGLIIGTLFFLCLKLVWGQEQTQVLDASKTIKISWTCSQNATGYIPERATGEGPFLPLAAVTVCSTTDTAQDLDTIRYRVRAHRDVTGYGRVFSEYSEVSNRAVAILYPSQPEGVKVSD